MGKQNALHAYNGTFSAWSTDVYDNMDKLWKHYAKQKKLFTQDYRLYW